MRGAGWTHLLGPTDKVIANRERGGLNGGAAYTPTRETKMALRDLEFMESMADLKQSPHYSPERW